MRPGPRAQHLIAVLIFAIYASAMGYLAMRETRLSDTQAYMATAALKYNDQSLYPSDPIFGDSKLWKFHTPAMQKVLNLVLRPTGYADVTLPFRVLAGAMVLVYLINMYALLFYQCRSWSVACFTAILSTAVIYTVRRSYWGIGSLTSVTPWALALALVPLLVLLYLKYCQDWPRVVLVFAAIGLVGNVHLVLAMTLALILGIVYIARHRFRPGAWLVAGLCGLAALIAALPYARYYFQLRSTFLPAGIQTPVSVAHETYRLSDFLILYPGMLLDILGWVTLVVLVLVIPAVVVFWRLERYRVRDMSFWMWFIGGALLVGLGLHGASQLVGYMAGTAPPVIDFAQALTLIMLPLYVMLAQALTNLFRLAPTHRLVLRLGCAAVMAGWLIPSDNFRLVRGAVMDSATMTMPEAEKPRSVQRHHEDFLRNKEMDAIAYWAREKTSRSTVFITDDLDFRMHSRRSVAICPKDDKYLYYLAPWRLEHWLKMMNRQKQLLHRPEGQAEAGVIRTFVEDLRAEDTFSNAGEWFIVIDADKTPAQLGPLEPVKSPQWGRYYGLFRVNLAGPLPPTSKPSTSKAAPRPLARPK